MDDSPPNESRASGDEPFELSLPSRRKRLIGEEEVEEDELDNVPGPAVAINVGGSTSSNVVVDSGRQMEQNDDGAMEINVDIQFLRWKEETEKARDIDAEEARWNKPSIFLVPEWMKDKEESYKPELVSLGPYHHGDPNLLPMEQHKLRAVQSMLSLSQPAADELKRSSQYLFSAIEGVADTLLEAYHDLDPSWRHGEKRNHFVRMMVNDGCFLLEFMRAVKSIDQGRCAMGGYAHNDPVFSMRGLISKCARISSDVLIMENQIPLLVLKQLLTVQHVSELYGTPAVCTQLSCPSKLISC